MSQETAMKIGQMMTLTSVLVEKKSKHKVFLCGVGQCTIETIGNVERKGNNKQN